MIRDVGLAATPVRTARPSTALLTARLLNDSASAISKRIVQGNAQTAQAGMLIVTLDLSELILTRRQFDPCGHYARPDVFRLTVNQPDPSLDKRGHPK